MTHFPLPLHPFQAHRFLAYPFLALILVACTEQSAQPLYGSPTPLAVNQSPLAAICAIQAEFRQLPKPLMVRQSYQGDWTSREIGAETVKHRGFIRIHLRAEALDFLRQHSRLEIVASLTPLFNDPDNGGEAAVLLAGIPAGTDADQGLLTRDLGTRIDRLGYSSPHRPGRWFDNDTFKYYYARALYGLTNTSSRIHRGEVPGFNHSLEQALVEVLTAYSRAPPIPFANGRLQAPQPNSQTAVKQWIETHEAPQLSQTARDFTDRYHDDFALLALLPLMPEPTLNLEPIEYYLMWLTGLEQRHWPALLTLAQGNTTINTLRLEFRQHIAQKSAAMCVN